jgi:hypothetical protein
MFFERPAADLPATGTRWDGATDWVLPPIVEPTITNLAFAPSAPGSRSGTLTFNVANYTGPVLVQMDANGEYTVTTRDPISGDGQIRNVVITPASNCSSGCATLTTSALPVTGPSLRTRFPLGVLLTILGVAALMFARAPTSSARRATRGRRH